MPMDLATKLSCLERFKARFLALKDKGSEINEFTVLTQAYIKAVDNYQSRIKLWKIDLETLKEIDPTFTTFDGNIESIRNQIEKEKQDKRDLDVKFSLAQPQANRGLRNSEAKYTKQQILDVQRDCRNYSIKEVVVIHDHKFSRSTLSRIKHHEFTGNTTD